MANVFQKVLRKLVNRYGGKIRDGFNKIVAPFSLVGNPDVFDTKLFSWSDHLAQNWADIQKEALAIFEDKAAVPALGDVSPDHKRLDQRSSWRAFFIWGYGYRMHENAALAPKTAAYLDAVPGLISAFYSAHEPGTHLPWHRGVTKGIITCHLGLKIPKDGQGCRIQVGQTDYFWKEGQWFIFDDTYHHEVWNDTEDTRIILLLQIRRPLKVPGRWVQNVFFFLIKHSPFVQEARRNIMTWTRNEAVRDRAA